MPPDITVYDANVLYPAPLRDLLVRVAIAGLTRARWSNRILDECFSNILLNRPEINESRLKRTRELMNDAIRDVLIDDATIETLPVTLPDPDDIHVLNAAVAAGARWIVTFNLKDFPHAALQPHNVSAIHPDLFLHELVMQTPSEVIEVIRRQANALQNPVQSFRELLSTLDQSGLYRTVAAIRDITNGD